MDRCLNNECQNGRCVPDELEQTGVQRKYKCDCLPGFVGANCEKRVDQCGSEPCQNQGKCVSLLTGGDQEGYRCVCKAGFSGKNCQTSVNYCSLLATRCNADNTARCVQVKGNRTSDRANIELTCGFI